MTEDFDKDIDSLLRQTARRETFDSRQFSAHIDADEISLFAENALPANARLQVTEHLADCIRCRKILSEVVLLNAESPAIEPAVKTPETAFVKTQTPWYKKLFAASSLAYSLGGLVVLLGGLLTFVALQNSKQSETASVAKPEPTMPMPMVSGPSADEEISSPASSANANVSQNTSVSASANSASNQVASGAMPKPSSVPTREVQPAANFAAVSNSSASPLPTVKNTESAAKPAPAAPVKDEEDAKEAVIDSPTIRTQNDPNQNYSIQADAAPTKTPSSAVSSKKIESLPNSGRETPQISADASVATAREAAVARKAESPTKTAGGKTFTRNQGVWYDSTYNQQRTTNVRRNSDEYKKLDADLRTIADSLGGTIVVVWQGKAYRIQ